MSDENIWTIRRCLEWTRSYLERKGDEHPRLSAEWMLSAVTGKSRMELYVSYDEPLSPRELSAMHGFIERRAAGEPLQYVTGRTGFRFIELSCAPGVLIPRPETEILVDAALESPSPSPASARRLASRRPTSRPRRSASPGRIATSLVWARGSTSSSATWPQASPPS